jgi:uncharacterized membrane protein
MDDKQMNEYLGVVEKNLKYLTISERADILNEIKSHIKEMQMTQKIDMNTVLHNMGDPVELGKSYVGKTIINTTSFNFKNFIRTISFYGATSIGGTILSVLAGSLYLCTFLTIIAGLIKTVGTLLGIDTSSVAFNVGSLEVPDILALPISLPIALFFYICSKKVWDILKSYLAKASNLKQV